MPVRPEFRGPILSTLATGVFLIAMCMPWGELRFNPLERPIGMSLPAEVAIPTPSGADTVTATGWSGALKLGIIIPNYAVLIAAGFIACLLWLRVFSVWTAPTGLLVGLALYGLIHSIIWFFVCLLAATATPGMGALLSAVM